MHMEAKKDLGPGRVMASLVCNEEWIEWDTDANGHQSRRERSREVYRHDIDVAHQFSMRAGDRQTLQFSLPTPSDRERNEPTSGFGRFLQTIGDMTRGGRDLNWSIEGKYDIPGLDLKDSRRVALQIDL